jgi:hypothetical protein
MPQLFPYSANALARSTVYGAVFFAGILGWLGYEADRSHFATGQGAQRQQPVAFSHAHHVGDDGIDCQYCHFSVEYSSFANIPPVKTCVGCHAQIWKTSPTLEPVRAAFRANGSIRWARVYDLPDFVYFNHSIHVDKGVGCETCHGRVDRMPLISQANSLRMDWCLDCHRNPERYVRPRELVTKMGYQPAGGQEEIGRRLVKEYRIQDARFLTSCSTCHR